MSDNTDSTKKTEENKEVVEEKKVVDVEKMTMDELLSTKKTEVAHHDNNDEMGTKAKSAEVTKAEDALFDAFDNDAELDDVNVGAGWADEGGAPDIVPVASAAPEVASIKKKASKSSTKPKNGYTAEDVADEEAGLDC